MSKRLLAVASLLTFALALSPAAATTVAAPANL